ncbi:single-stranded-DNA-specific exonuclease RecJ [Halanaerobium salsuginis]|jgi:single-stranded-DNA-specific exonuclease|uniref:Single-stranded-DNA-specific exonuclease RecJ n=1 Tax=Halanaerobium salsuginis TaxID=29563 RepID=A0A1I4GC85_9FIRM|nr:single-stranded-DNA-specific exonuclease RecJ [Halanaerobium salsuginis]SFL26771.1 exonuclease RecJ [Halanaerobium salsuginis]
MQKIWQLNAYSNTFNDKAELLTSILTKRGLETEQEQNLFLNPKLENLSDPFLLPGMATAVERIKNAIQNNEKILLYGDYDVDGISSTAVLYHFMKNKYQIEVEYFLPDRIEDGYGLNSAALERIAEKGIDLVITVDCGITAFKEAERAVELGLDLIITDHHTPGPNLPAALAVINHHLVEIEDYFAAEIAGVGTAFKLAQALNDNKIDNYLLELLPLVALGTIADLVPLRYENRVLVKNGLNRIAASKNIGLQCLIAAAGKKADSLSAGQIAFQIAPPLNAAGRINTPRQALELLLTTDPVEAEALADELIMLNKERQAAEEVIFQQAESKLAKIDIQNSKSIILGDSRWHSGIIGIVASRLLEKYNLPVILAAFDKERGLAKASCRSIPALNIHQALEHCQSELVNFGGHKAAAGLTITIEKMPIFKEKFNQYLSQTLTEEDYLAITRADLNLKPDFLTKDVINELEKLQPFGIANPAPRFLFKDLTVKKAYQIGKEKKHLKFYTDSGLEAIAFNFKNKAALIREQVVDLVAQPEINSWQGKENIQLKINDLKLTKFSEVPLLFSRSNYKFYDLRNHENRKKLLISLLDSAVFKQAAVYINQKTKVEKLNSFYPDHYFFSNPTLKKTNSDLTFSHLIIYSLPFSVKQLIEIIKLYTEHKLSKEIKIIFMNSTAEISFNKKIIRHSFPAQKEIYQLLILLNQLLQSAGNKVVNKSEFYNHYLAADLINRKSSRFFKISLEILAENKLINLSEQQIKLVTELKKELDFERVIRYNKLSRRMEKFLHLEELIFQTNLFDLAEFVSNFKEDKNES